MKIIIKMDSVKGINVLIDDIYIKHKDKIVSVKKKRREIELINGDNIKFITSDSRYNDGLRADVVVGHDTEFITCCSTQEKKEWDFVDLEKYLETIHV